MSAGKGDKPRPIKKQIFNKNFDEIDWNKKENKGIKVKNSKGKITFKY
jgi:hypothetical protein